MSKLSKIKSLSRPITRCLASQEDQELINSFRETTKAIVEKINPHVLAYEKAGKAPLHEIFRTLGDAGLLGISMPEKYGGLNLPYSINMAVAEEIGGIDNGSLPMAIGVQTDMATPALAEHGSEALCEEFLVPSIKGEVVGCIGVSEPHAGSDVSAIKTEATISEDGTEYIINGGKIWTTNVTQADWMCCLCNTEKDVKSVYKNKSLIIIPLKKTDGTRADGITISSHQMEKMGMRASDWGQTYFDNVRVPVGNLIGTPGMGFIYQMEQFQKERLVAAMIVLRPLERLISETASYCADRKIFGKSLLDQQHVQFKLAAMSVEVQLYKDSLWRTLEKLDAGENVVREASMLKYKLGQLTQEIPNTCLQFHGAQGYLFDSYVNRIMRDLRSSSIGGGADEVMLQVIARLEGFDTSKKGKK
jgi:citronellyl-CoA dehydrogenase